MSALQERMAASVVKNKPARRCRILFFSPVSHFKGGAERSLLDLLANPNVQAHLMTPGPGPIADKAAAAGIPTHVVTFGAIEHVHRPFRFRSALSAVQSFVLAVRELKR